jgi:dolichol-phosphate mannosyltransferase
MDRQVVEALKLLPERNRFVRGLRTWVGYRQTGLAYERQGRQAGEPKYTFAKLVRLGMDCIVNFSCKPLQMVMSFGLAIGVFTILAGALVAVLFLTNSAVFGYNPRQVRRWTSLALALCFLSGVQLISLGILGEYLGRLFEEVKRRPEFIIRNRLNFSRDAAPAARGDLAAERTGDLEPAQPGSAGRETNGESPGFGSPAQGPETSIFDI